MPKLEFAPATQFATVPMGWYVGEVENITEREAPPDKFHPQPYTKLEFTWIVKDASGAVLVDEESGTDITLRSWATVTKTFNPKAGLYAIADALGLVRDEQLLDADTDHWIGRSCNLNVLEELKGEGDQAVTRNRIDGYSKIVARPQRPAVKAQRTAPAQAVAAAAGSEEYVPF